MKLKKQIIIPAVLLVLFGVTAAGVFFLKGGKIEKVLSADEAAKKAIDFANKNMLTEENKAEFVSAKEENGLYTFKLKVAGQEYDSFVTKNGKMFFVQGVELVDATTTAETEKPATVTKSDKPDVKLFVMSYCPYGLQAEKMYLPVYDLLKGKADMAIYFVNYAMHGKAEVDENLRQYCIQKDQNDKFAAYLKCFMNDTKYTVCSSGGGKDCTGDYNKCLGEAAIDKTKLASCTAAADKQYSVTSNLNDKSKWVSETFPQFLVNDDLNKQFNVQGSPTIIINGAEASPSTRSPEAFKQTVCAAFNSEPEECKTVLSNDQPVSGFGAGIDSAGSASAGCATP